MYQIQICKLNQVYKLFKLTIMKIIMFLAVSLTLLVACTTEIKHDQKAESVPVATKPQPAEFADPKYAEIGKNMFTAMSRGDMAGYLSGYADNAVYQWNNGDSLAGKAAISEYWTKRRTEFIDSLSFSNEIWLPVKVNQPQSVEAPGVWLLAWYQVNAKYKTTGKTMVQWMHLDFHFDTNDKIDRVIHYVDRVPINAALAK
jgi:ketosteroid isomerase-like protein